jgi:hypothetical protein
MKKLIVLAACMSVTAVAFGAGQFNFNNRVAAAGIDARVFDVDGTTPLNGDGGWVAQAYVGATADSLGAVGSAVSFRNAPVPAGLGYILGGVVDVANGNAGDVLQSQMRVWNSNAGATYEAAVAASGIGGMSNIVPVTLGGGSVLPGDMVGLESFAVMVIPEPSTMALGMLGIGALMLRRRR